MKFEHVRIRNFKSHSNTDLSLDSGVTVIHGVNGSGKSSLLEACFFALYGSAAIDGTLEDAIASGTEEMDVTLSFSHGGAEYRVEREVKVRAESAQTTTCVLETPNGPIEQVRDVESYIEKLLRMDAEAFVNCAYVRQGEVNKLINATPRERQNMIDELLQLGTLETYRERASDARVGVKRVRDRKRELLADRDRAIEQKKGKALFDQLNELKSDRSELINEIEAKVQQRDAAEETLADAEETLEAYATRREELAELEDEIEELTETIAETERERADLDDRIRSRRETIDAYESDLESELEETAFDGTEPDDVDSDVVANRIETIVDQVDEVRELIEQRRLEARDHANEAENARNRAEELREEAERKRVEADELETDLESDRSELEERRERLAEIEDRIESLRERLERADVEQDDIDAYHESTQRELSKNRERLAELRTELKNARKDVREAELLLEQGKCPECGQPTDGSPHVEGIEDDRERIDDLESEIETVEAEIETIEGTLEQIEELLETDAELERLVENRNNLRSLLEQRRDALEETEKRVESLRETADEQEENASEQETRAVECEEAAAASRETIGDLNQRKAGLDQKRARLERIGSLIDDTDDAEREIEMLCERRTNKAELNDHRREQLGDKRDRKADLEESFDEAALNEAKAEKERAEQYLEEVEPYLEELRTERDELQSKVGAVTNELDELETLKTQRDELETTVERLDGLYEEAARLEDTYSELRHELRQHNVDRLETMLNEIFDLVYQNDSYSRIELDGEYELTVYQKDGTPLDPEQLSGGERALFNLSLRCGIYRLLSEGIEGEAPTPPLIFDEPTVFLDAGHVSKLIELIESMTDHGVAQIIVVSHDEELVGAADDLVAVYKDPTTNRSNVERSTSAAVLP